MPEETTTEIKPTIERTVELAGLPSRVLAAILDYLFVSILFVLLSRVLPNPDYAFLPGLLSGLFYFSIVHSALGRGQSLGKKLFGLRVVTRRADRMFLTQFEAALRYFAFVGAIILVREVPPVYFRAHGIVAEPEVLDLPMLFAMMYFCADVFCLIFDSRHRSLHDRVVDSIVIRGDAEDPALVGRLLAAVDQHASTSFFRGPSFSILCGALIGGFLWSLGMGSDPELAAVTARRYKLEQRLPIRVVSLSIGEDRLDLEGLALSSSASELPKLAEDIARFLKEENVLGERRKRLRLVFYQDPAKLPDDAASNRKAFDVDLSTMNVTEEKDEESPENKASRAEGK